MSLPDGAAQVWSIATRITALDPSGFPASGDSLFVTDALIKCTMVPTMETGDDLVTKTAAGEIGVHDKHGDMAKYLAVTLDYAVADPSLEQAICGGTLLSDSSAVVPAPSAGAAVPSLTGGVLGAATYSYRLTSANQYGESLPSGAFTGVVASGNTGKNVISWTAGAGAVYTRIYGRVAGKEQLLAQVPAATTSWTDTGAAVPLGAQPALDTTAGPGSGVGLQAPQLGIVGNPNGVSVEVWGKAIKKGWAASSQPYWRWVLPGCKNFHRDQSEFSNTVFANTFVGEAFENPNWGSGPVGDWQFDSTAVWQKTRASAATVPVPSVTPSVV